MSSDDSSGTSQIFTSTRIKENTKIKRKQKHQPTPAQISKITKNESPVIEGYQEVVSSTPIQNQPTKAVKFGTSSSSGSISQNIKKEKISPILKGLPVYSILKSSSVYDKWHSDNDTSSGLLISSENEKDVNREYEQERKSEIQDNQRHYLVQSDQLNIENNENKTVTPEDDEVKLIHMLRSLSTTPEEKKFTPKSFRTVQETFSFDKKETVKPERNQTHTKKVKTKKKKVSFSQRYDSGGGFYDLAWMSIHNVGKRILKKSYELWSESTDEKISYLTYGDWKRKLKLGEITKTPPLKNKEDEYLIKEEKDSKRTESATKRRRRRTKVKNEFTFKNRKKEKIRERTITENKSFELSDDFAPINHPNITLRRYNKHESESQEEISKSLTNDYLSDNYRKLSEVLISTPVKTPFVLPETSKMSSKKIKIMIIQKVRVYNRQIIVIPALPGIQPRANVNE